MFEPALQAQSKNQSYIIKKSLVPLSHLDYTYVKFIPTGDISYYYQWGPAEKVSHSFSVTWFALWSKSVTDTSEALRALSPAGCVSRTVMSKTNQVKKKMRSSFGRQKWVKQSHSKRTNEARKSIKIVSMGKWFGTWESLQWLFGERILKLGDRSQ